MPSLASSAPSGVLDPLIGLADRLDPPRRDVFALLGYEPNCALREAAKETGVPAERWPDACGRCPQERFFDAEEFDVLYGGAAGGGKTSALLMYGIRAADWYPGLKVGAFRRTYDELAESFLVELAKIDFARALGCTWRASPHPELHFPNGSVIRFRHLKRVEDATVRQGGAYQLILLDERTLIPHEAVSIVVDERVRTGTYGQPVLGVRSATNPGGVGHGYCKRRYIDATEYGKHTVTDDHGRSVRFIPAKVTDNPHIMRADPGYLDRLNAISDPARRKAMREGSWDSFAGQYFTEWDHDLHVVPAFTIPKAWRRYAGVDWGYGVPWAVVWGALHDGRLWVHRQIYEAQVTEQDQARRIVKAEAGDPSTFRVGDPQMWQNRQHAGVAHSIAHTYIAEGAVITPAKNERVTGWQRVHSYLQMGPACDLHRQQGLEQCPLLHVFDTCSELVHAIPNAPRDPDKPEDVDEDYDHDHDLDALRYLVMELPVPRPVKPVVVEPNTAEARLSRKIQAKRKPAKHKNHPMLGRR